MAAKPRLRKKGRTQPEATSIAFVRFRWSAKHQWEYSQNAMSPEGARQFALGMESAGNEAVPITIQLTTCEIDSLVERYIAGKLGVRS